MEAIESAWGCELHKLPVSYRVDYCAVRNRSIKGWVEIKCRQHSLYKYDTLMLSLGKWNFGLDLERTTGKPFFVVARFSCGAIVFARASKIDPVIVWGGRTKQTRDSADLEPVVMIPVKEMEDL